MACLKSLIRAGQPLDSTYHWPGLSDPREGFRRRSRIAISFGKWADAKINKSLSQQNIRTRCQVCCQIVSLVLCCKLIPGCSSEVVIICSSNVPRGSAIGRRWVPTSDGADWPGTAPSHTIGVSSKIVAAISICFPTLSINH